VIIEMSRVRVIGRRADLGRAVATLQDFGRLHLVDPSAGPAVAPHVADAAERRRRRAVERAVGDLDEAIAAVARLGVAVPRGDGGEVDVARAALRAPRLRRRADQLGARRRALADEAETLRVYAPLLADLDDLVRARDGRRRFSAYLLRLQRGSATVGEVEAAVERAIGRGYQLRSRPLPGGEAALLLLVGVGQAQAVDRALAGARVDPAVVPAALAAIIDEQGLPRIQPRLAAIDRELQAIRADAETLGGAGRDLSRARRALADEQLAWSARGLVGETARAFVIEGWTPARAVPALVAQVADRLGPTATVEVVSRDAWRAADAPVVLVNPPLFAPFERLTALLPLPRYGSVDPTPFVAVFFPMLFGVIVGDVGYGLLLAGVAAALWRRGARRGLSQDLSRIAAAVACYTIIFGVLYGELFGDLGARLLGMRPVWLDRAEAILPFLGLAIAIGLVHLLLGLVVGAVARRRRPREAAGRGVTALMLVLVAVAVLAVVELLPRALFTPAIVALLVAFPVVVALEGFTAILELVTTVGHVLSYARVMAVGTASVMLAVVANRMVGAFGSVAVGVLFALLFHVVNFAITVFSPTVQVLRLHYVEFFGTFFSPGGSRYEPFAHWAG
jgi:V/A-type H+/Na+-transporting ATPase subunit I